MDSKPEWLQEIYRMREAQDFRKLTEEGMLKLVEWVEKDKHSEEDAIILTRLSRLFEKDLSLKWEKFYKRFLKQYNNPKIVARFHRLASAMYSLEGKITEAEEAAVQALVFDPENPDNIKIYLTQLSELSIQTSLLLLEHCLTLRSNDLMTKYDVIVQLFRLCSFSKRVAQENRQHILDLCYEFLAEAPKTNWYTKSVVDIYRKVSNRSIDFNLDC
jgi:hypothetical protein